MKHTAFLIVFSLFSFIGSAQKISSSASYSISPADTTMLREVVVKSTRPLTTFTDEGRLTKIKGTELSKLGNAIDVLGFIPGVSTSNGQVEVIGKGSPLIYINGRKIRNLNELDQLSSTLIKDITVISNPGASYNASVGSVIKITAERPAGEGLSFNERTRAGVKNYPYGNELINMNYRSGETDVFSTLYYGYHKNKTLNSLTNDFKTPGNYTSSLTNLNHSSGHSVEAKLGFDHYLSSRHSFGIYYQFSHYPDKFNKLSDGFVRLDDNPTLYSTNTVEETEKSFNHLIDAFYNGKWGKWKADFTFTAYWRRIFDNLNSLEILDNTIPNPLSTSDKTSSSLFSGKLELSKAVWKGSMAFGTEVSRTDRHEYFRVHEGSLDDNTSVIKETNVSLFATLSQKFGPLSARVGLRYEYTRGTYTLDHNPSEVPSKEYNELLPSATLTLPVGPSSFQLSFSRTYIKPAYSQLSSAEIYSNSYMYFRGNPLLHPFYFNTLELDYEWKWLSLYLSYKRISGRILSQYAPYDDNSDIILETKVNSSRPMNVFDAVMVIAPGYIGKVYYPVFTAVLSAQDYKAPFFGDHKTLNNPMGIFRLRNLFRFSKTFNMVLYVEGQTAGDGENSWADGSWGSDLYINKSFGTHWNLQLAFEDIFNTRRNSRYLMYDEIGLSTLRRHVNQRKVQLSVTYKFNAAKSRYKGSGSGHSEKSRL